MGDIMLRVRHYTLTDKLIPKSIKIVNISDVHSDYLKLKDALTYAAFIDADIITIVGDLFDAIGNKNNQRIVELLYSQDRKIFISLGNHDYIDFDRKGFFGIFHKNDDMSYFNYLNSKPNIKVFINDDDIEEYDNIIFTAFDPGYSWYYDTEEDKELFSKLFKDYLDLFKDTDKFRIMLLHSCNGLIIDNELKNEIPNTNLVLSGHNHAGQTPEFIQSISKNNRGIVCPFEKFFMKGSYGYWTNNNTSVILSNGLTKMGEGHGPALLCKSMNAILKEDIEVINLVNGDKHELKMNKKELIKKI